MNATKMDASLPAGRCASPSTCPLNRARVGAEVRIKQLPDSAELTDRLREIGFCEERVIRLVASHSNVICQVCNSRLAISQQLAESILVESLEPRWVA